MRAGLVLAVVALLGAGGCSLPGDRDVEATDGGGVESRSGDEGRLIAETADRAGLSRADAEVFLADQDRFGEIVGQMRAQFPEQFADSEVVWRPDPGFVVTFVDRVPDEARGLVTGLSYEVDLRGDGQASEGSLERLHTKIRNLLVAQSTIRTSSGVDPERGIVEVIVPPGFQSESEELKNLLDDPRVELTEQVLSDDRDE